MGWLLAAAVLCVHFRITGGDGAPAGAGTGTGFLPAYTARVIDMSERMSSTASLALDRLTISTMTTLVATSVIIPLENNQALHVLDFKGQGKLPPVVLLHGISSCASDYYPIIRQLQQHSSRVIAVDLPGHGQTIANANQTLSQLETLMVTSLRACLKKLGVGKPILLGNSLGGFVGAKYASQYSRSLHSLILISPAGAPLSRSELVNIRRLFNVTTLGDATTFLETVLGGQSRLPFGLRQLVGWACRERTRRPAVQRILQEATIQNRLSEEEVNAITCPILLLWGQEENVFGTSQLEWFLRHLPPRSLSLVRPKGVGHIPHLDAATVTETIVDFIKNNQD